MWLLREVDEEIIFQGDIWDDYLSSCHSPILYRS